MLVNSQNVYNVNFCKYEIDPARLQAQFDIDFNIEVLLQPIGCSYKSAFANVMRLAMPIVMSNISLRDDMIAFATFYIMQS